jgi:hypothetical protein
MSNLFENKKPREIGKNSGLIEKLALPSDSMKTH